VAEKLKSTGVRLFLASELAFYAEGRPQPSTPEERADRQAEERGDLVFVAIGGFCDLEDDGRAFRIWGSFAAECPVRTDRDPTSELVAIAKESAEDRMFDMEHDLMRGNDQAITRWEFHCAPFSVELSQALRARFTTSWKGREPARLPGESEPNPFV
jgi:hypothetical protein